MLRSLFSALFLAAVLTGCATPANHYDPLEPINRPIYKFNDVADRYVLKPVAKGYTKVTPNVVQKGVSNFFGNIDDLFTAANGLLQAKFKQAGLDTLRVALNSTVGLLGVFDVATPAGLQKHDEDFGQTLGYWGVKSGPYLMLPLFGPTTLRDVTDTGIKYFWTPTDIIERRAVENTLLVLGAVDKRARLMGVDAMLEDALDPYTFIRDAYLQQRYNKVWDGNPPEPLLLSTDEDFDLDDGADVPAEGAAAPVAEKGAAPESSVTEPAVPAEPAITEPQPAAETVTPPAAETAPAPDSKAASAAAEPAASPAQ